MLLLLFSKLFKKGRFFWLIGCEERIFYMKTKVLFILESSGMKHWILVLFIQGYEEKDTRVNVG